MKRIYKVEEAVNPSVLSPGSRIYCAGNAATPQVILKALAADHSIKGVELLGVLLLGDIAELFSEECCARVTHRVIFNSHHSREAVNRGRAQYQLMHLSDIPRQLKEAIKPDVVFICVSGPDNGGNYSLGTTVEALPAAIASVKKKGGIVVAERNANMPFIMGPTIHEKDIDYLLDTDYDLPLSPVKAPDDQSRMIGRIIAELFIKDGSTLQYGIGEVPEAVTAAIIEKGVKDLGIHTELFADAMRNLIVKGIVTNRHTVNNTSTSTLFLSGEKRGYDWLNLNCSVHSMPASHTNSIIEIAKQPRMVAVNSAIGVDLHGNIWADSLNARQIYSGVGGQADFLRGAYQSPGGIPIIALKSTTTKGISKIMEKCPEGITTTAISADPVVIVTEQGAFNPCGLSIVEHAVGIAHLAESATRERLLKHIYDSKEFHNPTEALREGKPKGFRSHDGI